jgi:hypothetical protein
MAGARVMAVHDNLYILGRTRREESEGSQHKEMRNV